MTATPIPPPAAALPASADASDRPQLDADKLDCYRAALDFQALACRLLPHRGLAELRDQLERASLSAVLNIAEGAGRFAPLDKGRFFAIARGSATECAAIVDVLAARRLAAPADCAAARGLLVRVVQMLTKLIARMAADAAGR